MVSRRIVLIHFVCALVLTATCFGAERAIVPFGCSLDATDCTGPAYPDACGKHPLSEWPEVADPKNAGLPFRNAVPYRNGLGAEWAARLNAAFKEGRAAGLTQDRFRSFDQNHSRLQQQLFPQMNFVNPWPSYQAACKGVFTDRVTMGVQSLGTRKHAALGMKGGSLIEFYSREAIRAALSNEYTERYPTDRFFRAFYEHNFLLITPAVETFTPERDSFSFLSPFYLQSIGASGSDSKLLVPLVFASAALPPELKTRIMRKGLFVPTMMGLFKSHIAGDITLPAAHVPAYDLPKEAAPGYNGDTPFLDGLLSAAQGLTHIPPVARLKIVDATVNDTVKNRTAYYVDNLYSFIGVLSKGQTLILRIDLSYGWTDDGQSIKSYNAKKLHGAGAIEPLNEEGSLIKVTIPWTVTPMDGNFRSDFLFLVNDGTYISAPAYISIRNIHQLDPLMADMRVKQD